MAVDVTQIVISGACKVYIAPYSASALQAAPANTVDYGTAWGGTWVEAGYTEGGVMLTTNTEYVTANVDQVNAPVKDGIVSQTGKLSVVLREFTLAKLKQSLGYGTVTVGGAATEDKLGVGAADFFPQYLTVGFEGYAPVANGTTAKYRRVIGWKCLPTGEQEIGVKKDEIGGIKLDLDLRYEAQATSTERLYVIIDENT